MIPSSSDLRQEKIENCQSCRYCRLNLAETTSLPSGSPCPKLAYPSVETPMEISSINNVAPEIISEVFRFLDYSDQERLYHSCQACYHVLPYLLPLKIEHETQQLREQENTQTIARNELLSHNAFIRLLVRIYSTRRPDDQTLRRLASFFAQELISAWMYPTRRDGLALRINDSVADTTLYYQRYSLLLKLAAILRWYGAGRQIATIIEEWLDMKWKEISNDAEIVTLLNQDYSGNPPDYNFTEHQERYLNGLKILACHPVMYFGPQEAASDELSSRIDVESWSNPEFGRLKLWLSIPELWNIQVRHLEIHKLQDPYFRVFVRLAQRPFLQPILFRAAEFLGYALQIMQHIRFVEITTPGPELIHGTRYWYEEAFCASAIHWNFYLFRFAGQYIELFKRPFVDIIRGYVGLYGPQTLSDLILNMVFMVQAKQLPVRILIARTVMRELLGHGYEFLSATAKDAVAGLLPLHMQARQAPSEPKEEAPLGDRHKRT